MLRTRLVGDVAWVFFEFFGEHGRDILALGLIFVQTLTEILNF